MGNTDENACEAKTREWLENSKDTFNMYLAGKTYTEIKINEDLYSIDAHAAFADLCESELDIPGMRLELFFDCKQ